MSDARWSDVEAEIASAVRHFSRSAALHEAGGFDDDGLDGYRAQMGLMHALQSAHTSLEAGLVRALELIEEPVPTGADWHSALIKRVARALPHRPAILDANLARDADETRRFRHRAVRAYDSFDAELARHAVEAGARLAAALPEAVAAFRRAVDP